MKNNEDILKKILLHMKYDSKKTLKENEISLKKVLKESCIPANTILTQSESGKLRSEQYPELGKWGDGTCKCTNTPECLEFKTECCKKPKVSVDYEEYNVKTDYATDGSILELPRDAKIINRWSTSEILNMSNDSLTYLENCKTLRPNDVDNCMREYKEKMSKNVKDKSVHTFDVDGKIYRSCYSRYYTDVLNKVVLAPIDKVRWFVSYATPECRNGERWKGITKVEEPKSKETNSSGNKFDIVVPGATKNEYDDKTKLSFDLEL